MNEPVSSATIGEKIASTTLASGGLTISLWIDRFQEYSQLWITICYLIVASIAVIKSLISLKKELKNKKAK